MENKFKFFIKIIENIIIVFLGLILILLIALAVKKYILKEKFPSFWGQTIFVVKTESMYPTLLTDDIVIVDKNDRDFKVGDIVSYEENDYVVTHRIIAIEDEKLILQGDANNSADPAVEKARVVGKVTKTLRNLKIWKMIILDTRVDICLALTLCLLIVIKILNRFEEKMNGKEEKIFKD